MPKFFRRVTREAGTRLVLYFSGLVDGIAGERHPDWRMKHHDGTDKQFFQDFKIFNGYGNCPLSAYFDEWVGGPTARTGRAIRSGRFLVGWRLAGAVLLPALSGVLSRAHRLDRDVERSHQAPGLPRRLSAGLEPDRKRMARASATGSSKNSSLTASTAPATSARAGSSSARSTGAAAISSRRVPSTCTTWRA